MYYEFFIDFDMLPIIYLTRNSFSKNSTDLTLIS